MAELVDATHYMWGGRVKNGCIGSNPFLITQDF